MPTRPVSPTSHEITVFLSSPGDLEDHREVVRQAILVLNSANKPDDETFRYTLLEWPRSVAASVASYLQGAINQQVTDFDILICLLGPRMGTPTPRASSGTEEEFDRAYDSFLLSGRPQIQIYFSDIPVRPSQIESGQFAQVEVFKRKLNRLGVLSQDYHNLSELQHFLLLGIPRAATAARTGQQPPRRQSSNDESAGTRRIESVTLTSQLGNPQWASYLSIPAAAYRGKAFSVRWRMSTSWPYFRQGFKLTESREPVLSHGGVQTTGTNILIHLGRNASDREWFLSPYKHGLRLAEDIPLKGTVGKASADCELQVRAHGQILFLVDGVELRSDFLLIDGYPHVYLMAWGDEHSFTCDITNIEICG